MKLIKWLIIIAVVIGGIYLLESKTVEKKVENINASHTLTVEKYTTGIPNEVRQKINEDVKKAYQGLPMTR